ncbi:MAG: monofunctional biosynthetic peptidoglycan transglycosylase [Bacteroidales bacterium]|nr:monofunctional biosynthetic peptidoglycan transglycosylase [Bacteroidales bacterium]
MTPRKRKKTKTSGTKRKRSWKVKILCWIRNGIIALFLFTILQVFIFKWIPVYFTPLMIIRCVEQKMEGRSLKCEHQWVTIDEIAQPLCQAVVASEDNLFMDHRGFDFEQISKATEAAQKGKPLRGASTISQQTAKNVFLWPGRSFFRKGLEAYYTLLIELFWSKERIMEVYLNSIEMGDGIYGAQAVARSHFKKNASELTSSDAALIAATLPNPRRFNSARPSPYILKRRDQILSLMDKIMKVDMGKQLKSDKIGKPKFRSNKNRG